jgi:hypothetical protein
MRQALLLLDLPPHSCMYARTADEYPSRVLVVSSTAKKGGVEGRPHVVLLPPVTTLVGWPSSRMVGRVSRQISSRGRALSKAVAPLLQDLHGLQPERAEDESETVLAPSKVTRCQLTSSVQEGTKVCLCTPFLAIRQSSSPVACRRASSITLPCYQVSYCHNTTP